MSTPRDQERTSRAGPEGGPEKRLLMAGSEGAGETQLNLVMGFDLTPVSECALEVAADLTRRLGAQLHVVHVVDLGDYPIDPDRSDWEEQGKKLLAREREAVRTVLSTFNGRWTYHAWHGDPARLLVTVADEFDALMIVIGAPRDGVGAAISHLIQRSVTTGLTGHRGHRPVLVVPRNAVRPRPGGPLA